MARRSRIEGVQAPGSADCDLPNASSGKRDVGAGEIREVNLEVLRAAVANRGEFWNLHDFPMGQPGRLLESARKFDMEMADADASMYGEAVGAVASVSEFYLTQGRSALE